MHYLQTAIQNLFPIYWRFLGYPVSCLKGIVVDSIPFSLVETLVWIGLISLFFLIVLFVKGAYPWLKNHPLIFIFLLSGPILLLLMAMGQGAFPLSLAPSAWRKPLAKAYRGPALPYEKFKEQLSAHEQHLLTHFSLRDYQSYTEPQIVVQCDNALDQLLETLHLSPGRSVRAIKPMGPFTTTLGLAYGGPAFHDPFLGELAMVRYADMPTPRYWRLIGICHEEAHAKGFTREMDAEILTQLALNFSHDPLLKILGDIMYLRKSGEKVQFPRAISDEIIVSRVTLAKVEKQQWLVQFLRTMTKKIGFQNSGGKYGSRMGSEAWDLHHPFYATVEGIQNGDSTLFHR